jgi:hypothetical protein
MEPLGQHTVVQPAPFEAPAQLATHFTCEDGCGWQLALPSLAAAAATADVGASCLNREQPFVLAGQCSLLLLLLLLPLLLLWLLLLWWWLL